MASLLLDTNVISELAKPVPDPRVFDFLTRIDPEKQFTASICLAEIRFGIDRMPTGKRQQQLRRDVSRYLEMSLPGRILSFDERCALLYGQIRSGRDRVGRPISIEDAMIAATARANGLTLATRNIRDFAGCGLPLVNPWDGA